MKRTGFVLRWLACAEHFRGASLIDFGVELQVFDGFKEAHGSGSGDIARVNWIFKTDVNVGLGGEIVNLMWGHVVEHLVEGLPISQIAVMEMQPVFDCAK